MKQETDTKSFLKFFVITLSLLGSDSAEQFLYESAIIFKVLAAVIVFEAFYND